MVTKSKIILLLLNLLVLFGCANQMSPGGGEVDKIPPTVVESFPKDGTTNFNENYLEVKFSEYVDRMSVQNAIFISPALQRGFEYSWTGKTLNIEIKDTLKKNTTYTVTIGTDIADANNRNKMAEAFTFAFSTGNKIDKGKISGRVYDQKPEGILIYAYQTENFDPFITKPDYISQVGTNGKYSLAGLRDGSYKIMAIRDNLQDFLYQRNDDQFGVQNREAILSSQIVELNNLDFFLTREDTIPPKLSAAFMKDRNHLVIEFSEAVDSTKLNKDNFCLIDSVSNKRIKPDYFFKGDVKANQFYLAFKDTSSFKDFLLEASEFEDLHGNKVSKDRIGFVYKADKDTLVNKPVRVFANLAEEKVDFELPEVHLQFADAIDSVIVMNRISILDGKKTSLPFTIKKADDALFNICISSKLKQGSEYKLLFNAKDIPDLSNKSIDTVYQNKFTTSSELDFSGVAGTVTTTDSVQTYVVVESITTPKLTYKQKLNSKKKFDIGKVIPGKYLAWSFKDKNKNDNYDFGKINPFKLSEEFRFYPDTLNLRARWPVGDVNISFDK